MTASHHGHHWCSVCGKRFTRSDILRKHLRSHAPWPCNQCGQLFNDKAALTKHQADVSRMQFFIYVCIFVILVL